MEPLVAAVDQGTSSTRFLVSELAQGDWFVLVHRLHQYRNFMETLA